MSEFPGTETRIATATLRDEIERLQAKITLLENLCYAPHKAIQVAEADAARLRSLAEKMAEAIDDALVYMSDWAGHAYKDDTELAAELKSVIHDVQEALAPFDQHEGFVLPATSPAVTAGAEVIKAAVEETAAEDAHHAAYLQFLKDEVSRDVEAAEAKVGPARKKRRTAVAAYTAATKPEDSQP